MTILILCLLAGVVSGALTSFLDFSMLRGEIFDGVRIYFAKRAARRVDSIRGNTEMYDLLIKTLYETEFETFDDRINATNQVYWQIAIHDKRLVGWLCPVCLNARVNFFVFVIVAAVFWNFFPTWGVLIVFYLGVFAVSYLTMQIIN